MGKGGGAWCAVAGCSNTRKNTEGISFHRIPRDSNLKKKWISKCYRADKFNADNPLCSVCSTHFKEEDFVRDLKAELLNLKPRRILKEGSIPSQNLPKTDLPRTSSSGIKRNERMIAKEKKQMLQKLLQNAQCGVTSLSPSQNLPKTDLPRTSSGIEKNERRIAKETKQFMDVYKGTELLNLKPRQILKEGSIPSQNLPKTDLLRTSSGIERNERMIAKETKQMSEGADFHPCIVLQKNAEDFKILFDEGIKTCLDTWDLKIAELSSPQLLADPESELDAVFSKLKTGIFLHMKKMTADLNELWVDHLSVIKNTFINNVEKFLAATKLVTVTNIEVEASTVGKKRNRSPSPQDISKPAESIENLLIGSIVDEPSPKKFKMSSISPEVMCGPKQVASLGEFLDALREHEIQTCTKFVCTGSDKSFSEVDFSPTKNMKIHWKNDIPHYYIGRRNYACHLGKDTNVYQKKKYAEKRDSKASNELIFTDRRNLAQPTKKLGCPTVIKVSRVLNLPRFKVSNVTKWKKDKMVELIRQKVERGEDIGGENAYCFTLPPEESHQNHTLAVKESIDHKVRSKIKELVHEGNKKISDISALVEQFVANDLNETDRSRSRFHPSTKCVRSIVKSAKREIRRSGIDPKMTV